MAKEEWTSLRIRKSTRRKLEAFITSLTTAHDNNQYQPPMRHTVLITADDAICELLRRVESHKERVKAAKSRSKGNGQTDGGSANGEG